MKLWLTNLPRAAKRGISLSSDILLIPFTLWVAYCLRLDELYVPTLRVVTVFGLTTVATATLFVRLGLYRAVIRFAGIQLLTTVFIGVCFSVLALSFFNFLFQAPMPRSVPFIYFGLGIISIGGTRFLARTLLNLESHIGSEKVIIYGSGAAGIQLATALTQGIECHPVAFLDDDKKKHGTVVQGLKVYRPRHLKRLLDETKATAVLLAIANITPTSKSKIIEYLSQFDIRVQTIPSMADVLSGKAKIEEIRDVKIEELLGRDTVPPDEKLLDECITGKSVMVTGAGGSIGSELCRQIITRGPINLILFEQSEFNLYEIDKELFDNVHKTPIHSILGSVQDRELLYEVMSRFKVQTIYHAAAYKHVPLVEHNITAGLNNNVFGTEYCAEAAKLANVEKFVLISTDKAVRPTNFMGATKRLAEQILQDLAIQPDTKTIFTMVRFGNVLGSSGSVVPLFKKQILAGGPVTVTHPNVTRFFMTIPEAVQLVVQAGSLGEGGDVFVLDMGESIKIAKLAESMVHLMGKSLIEEGGEIEITFTGLRPGEKLYEELLIGENCVSTKHPMITRAIENQLESGDLKRLLHDFVKAAENRDTQLILTLMKQAVPEYVITGRLLDQINKPTEHVANLKARTNVM